MRSSERWIVYPDLAVLGTVTLSRQDTRPVTAAASKVIEAEGFVVRGSDGRVHATLGSAIPGLDPRLCPAMSPRRRIDDGDGNSCITLQSLPGASAVSINGGNGNPLAVVGEVGGWPSLALFDKEGQPRVELCFCPLELLPTPRDFEEANRAGKLPPGRGVSTRKERRA